MAPGLVPEAMGPPSALPRRESLLMRSERGQESLLARAEKLVVGDQVRAHRLCRENPTVPGTNQGPSVPLLAAKALPREEALLSRSKRVGKNTRPRRTATPCG